MFRALIALAAGLAVGYIHGYHVAEDETPKRATTANWSEGLDLMPDLMYGRGR